MSWKNLNIELYWNIKYHGKFISQKITLSRGNSRLGLRPGPTAVSTPSTAFSLTSGGSKRQTDALWNALYVESWNYLESHGGTDAWRGNIFKGRQSLPRQETWEFSMDFGHHFHRNVQRPSVRRRSLQLCRPGVISGYGYPILEESIQFLHYLGTFQLALMMVSNFKSISNQYQQISKS